MDKKSTLQASHEARRPISWYRSIELGKLNNFCSTRFKKNIDELTVIEQDTKSHVQVSH